MTLIDYLSRVHFADGILEEALWAELDQQTNQPVMVLSDADYLTGEEAIRFRDGLPVRRNIEEFSAPAGVPTEETALDLAARFQTLKCSVLIGFGPGHVMELAKIVRLLVGHDLPLANFSSSDGGAHRITGAMPKMIAVPTLTGVASGLDGLGFARLKTGEIIEISGKKLVPSVTICDPTLTRSSRREERASAGVAAFARCAEALLSPNFNPPANGIALDGLARAIRSLDHLATADPNEAPREIMAACLNAALVQQNGQGLTYAISNTLECLVPTALDRGALARLILPEVLEFHARGAPAALSPLAEALGAGAGGGAVRRVRKILKDQPLPDNLAAMGVTGAMIDTAVARIARHRAVTNGPVVPGAADIRAILSAVI